MSRGRRCFAALGAFAAVLAITPLAAAPATGPAPAPPVVDDPVLSPATRQATLGRDVLVVLGDRLAQQRGDEDQAKAQLDARVADAAAKRHIRDSLLERINGDNTDLAATREQYRRHGRDLVDLLQGSLMDIAGGAQLLTLNPQASSQRQYDTVLYQSVAKFLQGELTKESDHMQQLQGDLAEARLQTFLSEREIADADREVDEARAGYEAAKAIRETTEGLLPKVRTAALFPGLDINFIALDAYLRAARRIDAADSACGLQWWQIAAIGAIESGHGRGRGMLSDGTVTDLIAGPRLDGTDGNQLVVDTDKGALDEDDQFDHGVGPMQFIPETWKNRGADGNNDGVKDPQNFYDAALTTGRMLCADRGTSTLAKDDGYAAAVRQYNDSATYVKNVVAVAARYRKADLVPSRSVSLVVGGGLAGTATVMARQLSGAGWLAKATTGGDPTKIEQALNAPKATGDGVFLVVPDATWSLDDQTRVLNAIAQASSGLRVVWVPTAPQGLTVAFRNVLAQHANVQYVAPTAPPRSPWCGDPATCPSWGDWISAVLDQLG